MAKISVVVVDDHPLFLAGLRQLFQTQPDFALVGVAEDGVQLQAVLARTTPAVMLMDIEMPRLDGIQATAVVRQQAPDTKVVMLTGYENPEFLFRALKAGAVGYLLKTTRTKEIVETLRRVAAGELCLTPELADKFLQEFQRGQAGEDIRQLLHTLTPREEEVLRLVATTGANNREVSQCLGISALTIKMHMASIFRKLHVNDRTRAAILALKAGMRTP